MSSSSLATDARDGSLLQLAREQLTWAAEHLGLGPVDRRRLMAPARVVEVSVPDPRPYGDVVRAVRVQHSQRRGPAKGGVRMAASASRDEVEALALLMTLKTATVGLPLGGGKAGVVADPGEFDDEQREALMEALGVAWAPVIGPDHDVLGPDVGTGEAEMAALDRAWRNTTGAATGTAATGKPVEAGGLAFRSGATARGLEIVFDAFAERLDLDDELRVAVHGYGSVGRGIAHRLADRGHRVVAVSDSGGGAADPDGLDLDELDERKDRAGSVSTGDMASAAVLTVGCDLLVPAALQGVIDLDVASAVEAAVVLEGANGPCTWKGHRTLSERGVTVIPDILANSGGVSASYQEMTPPDQRDDEDTIAARFERRLRDGVDEVWETATADSIDLRTAAASVAIRRVMDDDQEDT